MCIFHFVHPSQRWDTFQRKYTNNWGGIIQNSSKSHRKIANHFHVRVFWKRNQACLQKHIQNTNELHQQIQRGFLCCGIEISQHKDSGPRTVWVRWVAIREVVLFPTRWSSITVWKLTRNQAKHRCSKKQHISVHISVYDRVLACFCLWKGICDVAQTDEQKMSEESVAQTEKEGCDCEKVSVLCECVLYLCTHVILCVGKYRNESTMWESRLD